MKPSLLVHIYNPTPMVRQEADTGESLEAHRPATLGAVVKPEITETISNKVEGEDQQPRLFSNLHIVYTCLHTHIHIPQVTRACMTKFSGR